MEGKASEEARTPNSLHSLLNNTCSIRCHLFSPALQSPSISPPVCSCCTVKDALSHRLCIHVTLTRSSSLPLCLFLCVPRILKRDGRKEAHMDRGRKEEEIERETKELLLLATFSITSSPNVSLISKRKEGSRRLAVIKS